MSARLLRAARRVPIKLMLSVVFVSLLLREFYPFSWFPMYSNFSGHTWYVYVTDHRDQPIALRERFRVTTPFLKKAYYANLRAAQDSRSEPSLSPERDAALATLRFVTTEVRPKHAGTPCVGLRLWKVELTRRDREIARDRSLLGELGCP